MGNKHFAMVSEWMVNGNINEFILTNLNANRFNLVGYHLYFWLHRALIFHSYS